MSVFTTLTFSECQSFLKNYTPEKLLEFNPVLSGVTNSIYQINTESNAYVLIIFERKTWEEAEFYTQVLKHYQNLSIPVAFLLCRKDQKPLSTFQNKPAILLQHAKGGCVLKPTTTQVKKLGALLAQMHQTSGSFLHKKTYERSDRWRIEACNTVMCYLQPEQKELLLSELAYQKNFKTPLPQGLIHGDLFRDNVLFSENEISAVLDFDFSAIDHFLLDIGIVINDWCWDENKIEPQKKEALFTGYESIRELTESEKNELSRFCRLSALNFWLSRLKDFFFQIPTTLTSVTVKNPIDMQKILEWHLKQSGPL